MDSISVEQILSRAKCLENENPEHTFHKSYYHFVNYFLGKDKITEQDLVIGANFTYGWMPTMLHFKTDKFKDVVAVLNKAKDTELISNSDLLLLKELVNNSLVGASKLLHFINPKVYPIWDSRVCNFLTGMSYKYKVEQTKLYWSYLKLCHRVCEDQRFIDIHNSFVKTIGYEVYPTRTVEQVMFINSENPL